MQKYHKIEATHFRKDGDQTRLYWVKRGRVYAWIVDRWMYDCWLKDFPHKLESL